MTTSLSLNFINNNSLKFNFFIKKVYNRFIPFLFVLLVQNFWGYLSNEIIKILSFLIPHFAN